MAKPEQNIRMGNINVAIWNNIKEINGQVKELKSITLEKRYKDKEGNWKSTTSFNADELPKAIMALSKAFSELVSKKKTNSGE